MDYTKLKESVNSLEISRNPNWFYHSFEYKPYDFSDMMKSGLKCRFLTSKSKNIITRIQENVGFNGSFFISLSKNNLLDNSAFVTFSEYSPMFILENTKPIKCCQNRFFSVFDNTIFPIRYSEWQDEYQMFLKIPCDKIIGLEAKVIKWCVENRKEELMCLRNILLQMKELNINLPLYDFSAFENSMREVDKENFIRLSKDL